MKATIDGIISSKEVTLLEKLGGKNIVYQYSSNLTIIDNANTGILWVLNSIAESSLTPRGIKLFKRDRRDKYIEDKSSCLS